MKILSLHIDGFGKFHDRDISFEDGLNVVYGKNEAGKSTLHTFIKGMLPIPNFSPGPRAGSMKVSCGLNVTGKFTALSAVSRRGTSACA